MTHRSVCLNKVGVEGQSDRRDLISLVQASTSHCLLCRHTTDSVTFLRVDLREAKG